MEACLFEVVEWKRRVKPHLGGVASRVVEAGLAASDAVPEGRRQSHRPTLKVNTRTCQLREQTQSSNSRHGHVGDKAGGDVVADDVGEGDLARVVDGDAESRRLGAAQVLSLLASQQEEEA
jgi:hypothetical protein